MKVLVTRGTVASGQDLEVGQTYDISEADARLLLASNKAVEAPEVVEAPACPPVKPKPAAKKPKTDGDS